ncbi:MAG: 4-amino-4-deoxy-L-arabinose-phosphoundecaprenol flippase subunit ArnF [Anaerolineae bacterium]|nr:4-amino-4-deoxy-L-arabinose-phosphoundecaprenol flippase subunit ArnF [Anaerolineae bacterium]
MITPDQLEFEEREAAARDAAKYHSPRAIFQAMLLLIPAILLSTTGQLFLKMGMNQVPDFAFTPDAVLTALPSIVFNPLIWIGFAGFIGGTVFWLGVISRAPLSLAYPVLAMSYFVVVLEAWLFLGEQVSLQKIIGVAVIVGGVILVGLSEQRKGQGQHE